MVAVMKWASSQWKLDICHRLIKTKLWDIGLKTRDN